MYQDYFGLSEAPFSIAPNPQYLYMSDRHREALAHLLYGIKSDGGFILLTGEVGTGKTTVCRCLLEQIPEEVDIAFILNPKLTAVELLATACDDLGIAYPDDASIKVLVDNLNTFLLDAHKAGRRTVLIIDEAQNLSVDVLEQLRLLTNLETNQRKLLQIILLGQPELLDMLAQPALRQLSQRVTARFHLDALRRNEVTEYIQHRLNIAGGRGTFFPKTTIDRIFKLSGGIPRVINLICDRSLLGTYAENKLQVTKAIVNKAADEILGEQEKKSNRHYGIAATLLLVIAAGAFLFLNQNQPPPVALTEPPEAEPVTNHMDGSLVTTATATPAFTEPDPARILDNIENVRGHANVERAFNDMFALWGVVFSQDDTRPCDLARTIGLSCFSNLSSLRELENLNRPVVLGFNNEWFTLSHLENGVATLIAGDQQFEVSVSDLAHVWDGKYTLFWRTPPAFSRPITRGDDGPSVDWLVTRLATLNNETSDNTANHVFDEEIEERVKRFQLSTGLTPDGIVGVKTWIHINNLERGDIPVLQEGEG